MQANKPAEYSTLMTFEAMLGQLPKLVAVMGEKWLWQNRAWAEPFIGQRLAWYDRLERDLAILEPLVGSEKLINCYRDSLRNEPQIQNTIFEIHGAALLATAATKMRLHVPLGDASGKDFDVWAEIRGHPINVESKTRNDKFPFNLPPESEDPAGITWYAGSRATMDPHDAADLGIEAMPRTPGLDHVDIPESTEIRQRLLEGLAQLPHHGCNVIIFGHILGRRCDLEDALYGQGVQHYLFNRETKRHTPVCIRATTGAFNEGSAGEPFRTLSAILWVRLWAHGDVLGRAYQFYPNPNALQAFPSDVVDAVGAVEQWTTQTEIQERSLEDEDLPGYGDSHVHLE